MKNYNFIFYFVLLFFLTNCGNSGKPTVKYASGCTGDILVVMENERWNSESGEAVKLVFEKESETLPMEEPLFDLHQLQKEQFKGANRTHKNVIYQEIKPDLEKSSIKIIKDRYAINQIFVHIIAKNQTEFVKIVLEHTNELRNLFKNGERNRLINQFTKYNNQLVFNKLQEKFNISVKMPKKFIISAEKPHFLWISNENKNYTQNIIVYSYPLSDTTSLEINYLIAKRNEFTEKFIPGEYEGSYMTTETKFAYPQLEIIKRHKSETAVLEGLWKVKGDFMGGPFISYTKIDERRNLVVTVEGFVYYPNHETRELIRELDAILYTFDFVF